MRALPAPSVLGRPERLHRYETAQDVFAFALIPALALLALGTFLEQTRQRRLP